MRSAVGPVSETDTTDASQSSYAKIFASGGSFQDVCDELIGVGQNRPVQRPSLFLTFCGERFAISQTMTFAVILPRTVTLRQSLLPDCWNERIGRSNASKKKPKNSSFIFRKLCLSYPVMCLDFHDYTRNEIAEKKSDQLKLRCSKRSTGSNRQSAANEHRVFHVICK